MPFTYATQQNYWHPSTDDESFGDATRHDERTTHFHPTLSSRESVSSDWSEDSAVFFDACRGRRVSHPRSPTRERVQMRFT